MQIEKWVPASEGRILSVQPDKPVREVCRVTDPKEQILIMTTPLLFKSTKTAEELVKWIKAHIPENRWPAGLEAKRFQIDSTLGILKEWTCD